MHYLRLLLLRLAIVYLLFFLCRLSFYLYNAASFADITTGELVFIFVAALRFDTSAILYANVAVILLHLIPFSIRAAEWYQKMLRGVFVLSNTVVIFFELSDVIYFPYAFRRMLRTDFEMSGDFQNLLPEFLMEFWWLAIFYLFLIVLANYLYGKTKTKILARPSFVSQLFLLLLGIGGMILGMRGGFQTRPIMPIAASQYVSNMQYMPLVSNTTLGIIHSFQQRTISKKNYFDQESLSRIYTLKKKATQDSFQKKNVVILVCESLGREYVGYFGKQESHTPFLDSMLGEGLNFVNMYANGTRSTQGIVAIAGGIPALMLDPFMFSAYQNNNIVGLGDILAKEGYTNAFFHGGEVGTMGFDQFMPITGVNKYYGRKQYIENNNYSENQDYDGNWGIWDIPFYDYALKEIAAYTKPFFATLFSINVHHPFKVEPWFANLHSGVDKRLVAIKYADYNLRVFFEKAAKQDWFDNTIFVITADHTGPHRSAKYVHREGCYRIPLLIYSPSDSTLKGVRKEVSQQIDIMPSILGYLGYSKAYESFGVNKFDKTNTQHYSYTFEKDLFQIIGGDFVLLFDGEESIALYNHVTDIFLKKNVIQKFPKVAARLEKQLKAVIQSHHHKLIENQ